MKVNIIEAKLGLIELSLGREAEGELKAPI